MKKVNQGFNYYSNKGSFKVNAIEVKKDRTGYHDEITTDPEEIKMCLNCKRKKCSGSDYRVAQCKKENGIG